ncbi:MAG: hypothetical protein GX086_01525 [Alcaligenaceae bacterium]|nr:hypothetical protein [Alcaligenaceae bacterium]
MTTICRKADLTSPLPRRQQTAHAIALGKPVWVYFPHTGDLLQQVPDINSGRCAQGWLVEDFGLPRNLMLACQRHGYSPTVEEAIAEMARLLVRQAAHGSNAT